MSEQVKDSFVIYPNIVDSLKRLPSDLRLEVYDALMLFGMTGEIPKEISPIAESLIISYSTSIENAKKRREANQKNGGLGGRPKISENPKEPNETQPNPAEPNHNPNKANVTEINPTKPNPNLNVNVNANANVNVNSSNLKSELAQGAGPLFEPPTFSEVANYCSKNKIRIDAQTFIDYYTARGWLVDGAPMQSWHAMVRLWSKREYRASSGGGRGGGTGEAGAQTQQQKQNAGFYDALAKFAQGDE